MTTQWYLAFIIIIIRLFSLKTSIEVVWLLKCLPTISCSQHFSSALHKIAPQCLYIPAWCNCVSWMFSLYMPQWHSCFLDILYFTFPGSCPQALLKVGLHVSQCPSQDSLILFWFIFNGCLSAPIFLRNFNWSLCLPAHF